MRLPNVDQAIISETKLVEYLLSQIHPRGKHKAKFFARLGYGSEDWQELAQALLHHAETHEVANTETTEFGTLYVVEGDLESSSEFPAWVRVVWFIAEDDSIPHLVTAYPAERGTE